jgi:ribonuclease P protein component
MPSPAIPTALRFRPHQRIRRARDFQRIYRDGARARGATLSVVALSNALPHARLGLSVGKRCSKSAVRRNRVRRILREAFRLSQADLPAGVDLIVIATASELDPGLAETRVELVHLARKAAARLAGRA